MRAGALAQVLPATRPVKLQAERLAGRLVTGAGHRIRGRKGDALQARNFSIIHVPAGSSVRGYRALVAARRAVCTMANRGFPGSELVAITTGIVPARMPKKICRHAEPSQ